MRFRQCELVECNRSPSHKSPESQKGYWPGTLAPPDDKAWEKSVKAFRADLKAMADLAANESTDLFAKIPHGDGQTVLREVLLLADHNAYHLGELVLLLRLLGPCQSSVLPPPPFPV